jgi:hypothetical protein
MSVKKRNWAMVVYPDSAPDNWIDILQLTGLQCAISPLHDKDLDPTGLPKKPHWHVICCYSGPTSYDVVKRLADSLNAPIPQALEQVKGYYRYLTHKDNPDKYQYDECDIRTVNGFDIVDYCDLSKSETREIKSRVQMIIRRLDIYEYSDLLDYLLDNQLLTEYDYASEHTILFDGYIRSRRYKSAKLNSDYKS